MGQNFIVWFINDCGQSTLNIDPTQIIIRINLCGCRKNFATSRQKAYGNPLKGMIGSVDSEFNLIYHSLK